MNAGDFAPQHHLLPPQVFENTWNVAILFRDGKVVALNYIYSLCLLDRTVKHQQPPHRMWIILAKQLVCIAPSEGILRMDTFSRSSSSSYITALLTDIYCRLWLQSLYMKWIVVAHLCIAIMGFGLAVHALMERDVLPHVLYWNFYILHIYVSFECRLSRNSTASYKYCYLLLSWHYYVVFRRSDWGIRCCMTVEMVLWRQIFVFAIGPLTLLCCNNFWFQCTLYTLLVYLFGHLKK